MKYRYDIINALIEKYNYKWYLELGIFDRDNFDKVKCEFKVGVDPEPICDNLENISKETSDSFFQSSKFKFDIIFIDGLHHAVQVYKDILNSLEHLNEGGIIVLHDISPMEFIHQRVPRVVNGVKQGLWNGDCWLPFVWLKATRDDLFMATVDTDFGVGIIGKGKQELIHINENITFENLCNNRKEWINLISVDEFKEKFL